MREIQVLKMTKNYKRRFEQKFGKPQKKESNRNPGNRKSL
jgi:hypothetical protein